MISAKPVPNNKILDWSKFKAFADDKINMIKKIKMCLRCVKNIVIPSFVHGCIYSEWFSPVAIFRTGFSFVEYCSGIFRAFLQSDY